jgi:hypothetical protein
MTCDQVDKRLTKCQKDKAHYGDEIAALIKVRSAVIGYNSSMIRCVCADQIREKLDEGLPARSASLSQHEQDIVKGHMFLTMKNVGSRLLAICLYSHLELSCVSTLRLLVRLYMPQTSQTQILPLETRCRSWFKHMPTTRIVNLFLCLLR